MFAFVNTDILKKKKKIDLRIICLWKTVVLN